MCGINIFVDKRDRHGPGVVQSMLEATSHRGPDQRGLCTVELEDCRVHFGVNRLKISGLTGASDQPFQTSPGDNLLAFNGAVYNTGPLKNDLLAKGYRFRSTSDTEVLYHHLTHHGVDGVASINGMYAFAHFDANHRAIYLARDRFGIKPLYYFENDAFLLVSSEIRGILASGLVPRVLNTRQVGHYLTSRYAKPPETFYRDIYLLPPGTVATWQPAGGIVLREHHHHPARPAEPAEVAPYGVVGHIHTALRDALLDMLDTEVPLGLLLSGGVDSTLLLALARNNGFAIPAFTVHNGHSAYGTRDEVFARKAARQYGTSIVTVGAEDIAPEKVVQHIQSLDQPIGDSSTLMTQLISAEAAKSVKVLLSGAGADELFAGYNRHRAYHLYLKYRKYLKAGRPLFPYLRSLMSAVSLKSLHTPTRLLHKLLDSITDDPQSTFHRMSSLSFGRYREYDLNGKSPETSPVPGDLLRQALDADRYGYLVSDVLALTDSMSMRHSLEVRLPYLDNRVSEAALQLPATFLIGKGRKWILRELLRSLHGKPYTVRRKEGFGLPVGLWLRNKKHDYLWEPLKSENSELHRYVDRKITADIAERHLSQKADYSQEIWALTVLGHWLEGEFG